MTIENAVAFFADVIREAAAQRTPLRLRGGGTKDFYGRRAGEATLLDTRAHAGIVCYDPTELVMTARCGTPLADVEAALAEHGQMLAFEPPHFAGADEPSRATFGGMIAAGLSGPRRAACGAVRDFVLGVRLMDGQARDLRFGGQVMKNVAGYDVSRFMAGSLGTLALIVEASVKTLPRFPAEMTVSLTMNQADAIDRLNRWAAKGLCVTGSVWWRDALTVRLSGASAAVKVAVEQMGGERMDAAAAARFWCDIRDQRHAFFQNQAPLWRLSVPQTARLLDALKGEQLVEWGGAVRWLVSEAAAQAVREAAARIGGHATLFRGGERSSEVFHPLSAPLARIHHELKAAFDPASIFNPGRMYQDL